MLDRVLTRARSAFSLLIKRAHFCGEDDRGRAVQASLFIGLLYIVTEWTLFIAGSIGGPLSVLFKTGGAADNRPLHPVFFELVHVLVAAGTRTLNRCLRGLFSH